MFDEQASKSYQINLPRGDGPIGMDRTAVAAFVNTEKRRGIQDRNHHTVFQLFHHTDQSDRSRLLHDMFFVTGFQNRAVIFISENINSDHGLYSGRFPCVQYHVEISLGAGRFTKDCRRTSAHDYSHTIYILLDNIPAKAKPAAEKRFLLADLSCSLCGVCSDPGIFFRILSLSLFEHRRTWISESIVEFRWSRSRISGFIPVVCVDQQSGEQQKKIEPF
jgi:hypothetical protein